MPDTPTGSLNSTVNIAVKRAKPQPPPRQFVKPGWISAHCGASRVRRHKNCYSLKCDCWCHKNEQALFGFVVAKESKKQMKET
jgi:hypothetical protein